MSSVCPAGPSAQKDLVLGHMAFTSKQSFHKQSLIVGGSSPSSPGIDGHMEASCWTCATLTAACNWAGIKGVHAALTGTNAGGGILLSVRDVK